jgi:transposase InsO family protein
VTRLCALYGVTRAGYYAWRRRPESARTEQDRRLTERIELLFRRHRGCYGSPRIHEELRREGWRVSRRRGDLSQRLGQRVRRRVVPRPGPRVEYAPELEPAWARGERPHGILLSFTKAEVIHGAEFTSEQALRRAGANYIRYYNRTRLHSALGYRSPVDLEVRAA